MFRSRRKQILPTIAVILLSAVLIGSIAWFGYSVIHDLKMSLVPGLKMAFPVLILIFSILAFRGIRRDERLVKSYDRLR
jgi:purine-cytosine permease-like protein